MDGTDDGERSAAPTAIPQNPADLRGATARAVASRLENAGNIATIKADVLTLLFSTQQETESEDPQRRQSAGYLAAGIVDALAGLDFVAALGAEACLAATLAVGNGLAAGAGDLRDPLLTLLQFDSPEFDADARAARQVILAGMLWQQARSGDHSRLTELVHVLEEINAADETVESHLDCDNALWLNQKELETDSDEWTGLQSRRITHLRRAVDLSVGKEQSAVCKARLGSALLVTVDDEAVPPELAELLGDCWEHRALLTDALYCDFGGQYGALLSRTADTPETIRAAESILLEVSGRAEKADSVFVLPTCVALSDHYDTHSDPAKAAQYAQKAVDAFEYRWGTGEYFAESVDLFSQVTGCFLRLLDSAIARRSVGDIAEICARMRARVLRSFATRTPVSPSRLVSEELWQQTLRRIAEEEKTSGEADDAVLADLRKADPGAARLFERAPVFADIVRWLPRQTACLLIAPGTREMAICALVADGQGETREEMVTCAASLDEMLDVLSGWVVAYDELRRPGASDPIVKMPQALAKMIALLENSGLADAIRALAGEMTRLVLIPLHPVAAFPIHALRCSDGLQLIDKYTISYLPTASFLGFRSAQRYDASARLLAVYDPRPEGASGLPFAGIEQAIAIHHFADPRTLGGRSATRAAVLDELSTAQFWHHCGHGWHTMRGVGKLSLADGELAPLLWEVLERAPDFVFLSGCETGMSSVTLMVNEDLSFPAALLAAGARGVVSTLWQIRDLTAALFAYQFYRGLRHRKLAPAAAICAAQRWLRDATGAELAHACDDIVALAPDSATPTSLRGWADRLRSNASVRLFADPLHWAGFTYTGIQETAHD
jgi:hypothetical protein